MPLFHRLLQRRLQHRMDTPHEGVGQGLVVLFRSTGHPTVFFQVVIHSLDVDGRELLKLDRADDRDDVVFNDPLIALGGVVADNVAVDQIAVSALGVAVPLLSVSGKPVDAPLPNREIIFFLHIIASFLANEQYHRKQEIATEKNIK